MRTVHPFERQERGIALVIAMLTLLVISMFAAVLMMTVSVQSKLTGQDSRRQRALNLAEAGVAEAVSRIKVGDVPANMNPNMVAQVYNVAAGSVPVLGADSTGLATSQPAGTWLGYTTADRDPDALTITYKTDPGRNVIYRYDSSRNPAVNTTSGPPIYTVTATGKVGSTERTVVVDVVARPPSFNPKGAMYTGGQNDVHNGIYVCGYNHRWNTPDLTAIRCGRTNAVANNPGADAPHTSCLAYEVGANDQAGLYGGGAVAFDPALSGPAAGAPPLLGNQASKYAGPWDALGMTQADFQTWLPPRSATLPTNWNGSFFLDKDATFNNNQGGNQTWTLTNVNGSGYLYLDGHVIINGNFTWKGMVYVNGQLECLGRIWVLGSLIGSAQGEVQAAGNGGAILYSKDAVDYFLATYAGQYTQLAWHEINR